MATTYRFSPIPAHVKHNLLLRNLGKSKAPGREGDGGGHLEGSGFFDLGLTRSVVEHPNQY